MNFKEFIQFGYQSKYVPVLGSGDDVIATFRFVARQAQIHAEEDRKVTKVAEKNSKSLGTGFTTQKEVVAKSALAKENLANNYFDFEGFKAALVRLTILSVDILGG